MPKSLKNINVSEEEINVTYLIAHNNGKTVLDLCLDMKKTPAGWRSSMDLSSIPLKSTATESAHAYADWLERIAKEIKGHQYDEIDLKDVSFIR